MPEHTITFSVDDRATHAVVLVRDLATPQPNVAAAKLDARTFRLIGEYLAALVDASMYANDGTSNAPPPPPVLPSASLADPERKQWLYLTIARGASAATAYPILALADQDAIREIVERLQEYLASYTRPAPEPPERIGGMTQKEMRESLGNVRPLDLPRR